jgi:hypothetical protein
MALATRRPVVETSEDAVREMHAFLYRRLSRQIAVHRRDLSDDAIRLLTKAAFALYLDSLPGDQPDRNRAA